MLILSGTSWNTHIFSCEDSDSWSIRKPHIPDNRFLDEPSVTHKGMPSAIPMVAQIINNSFMSDNTSNKDVINLDYFSRNKTECLKGLLAILVLVHHIYQKAHLFEEYPFIDYLLKYLGYYCVSGFFFISGYGLYSSLKRNRGGIYVNIRRKESYRYSSSMRC